MRTGSWSKAVPRTTKVVVVAFGSDIEEYEEEDEDEEDEEEKAEEKGTVRSCAEMAFAIFLKKGQGSVGEEELLLPFTTGEIFWSKKSDLRSASTIRKRLWLLDSSTVKLV